MTIQYFEVSNVMSLSACDKPESIQGYTWRNIRVNGTTKTADGMVLVEGSGFITVDVTIGTKDGQIELAQCETEYPRILEMLEGTILPTA